MMLVEEGKIGLADPLSKYIPAFARTTVAVPPPAGAVAGTPVSAVPAKRAITIRDRLTHTAGIGYGEGIGRSSASEFEGRLLFGIVAALMDLAIAYGAVAAVRARLGAAGSPSSRSTLQAPR